MCQCVCVCAAYRQVLLAHVHALTLTYIYKDSDFGAKTDSSLPTRSRPRALHLHRVPRAASLLLSAHCIAAQRRRRRQRRQQKNLSARQDFPLLQTSCARIQPH